MSRKVKAAVKKSSAKRVKKADAKSAKKAGQCSSVSAAGRLYQQLREHREASLREPMWSGLSALSKVSIQAWLVSKQVVFRDRLYPPWVTLWIFLWQVLSPDCSCQCALASWLAARGFQGLTSCSSDSGSYCDARKRLPLELVRQCVQRTGQEVQQGADSAGLFHGRPTKVVDGSTASMPDTPENAAHFHKPGNQTSTPLFPLLRMVVVFSLATGAALDLALGPYRGKETGEISLFRTLRRAFQKLDIVIGDRIFGTYCDIAQLLAQGVDGVYRWHAQRHADFRKGQRLGKDDHLVEWSRPVKQPDWLTPDEWALIPLTLTLREIRVQIKIPGFRVKSLIIVTTLIDAVEYPAHEIADLYRQRWHSELDLRSIKCALHMDVLRCKTPDMIEKELAMHFVAYNLIRHLMSTAAQTHDTTVRELSFTATRNLTQAFHLLLLSCPADRLEDFVNRLLRAISEHPTGQRPDRSEPRQRRRRDKPYPTLKTTRQQARKACKSPSRTA